MSLTDLHIISFDIPSPPDYGGVIDVFYKLKALHAAGVKIRLHCFEYGRERDDSLFSFCKEVHYYKRKSGFPLLLKSAPYIVVSRDSADLKHRLLQNNFPILMEGLHSTFLLNDPAFKGRTMVVRTHNVEHDYYRGLARVEQKWLKRFYFQQEAEKLKKYETILSGAQALAAISRADQTHFLHLNRRTACIPAFHPFDDLTIVPGKGDYAFYHGNLSIGENNEAALYLVREVFNDLPFKLIIAGSNPSDELKVAVSNKANIELKEYLPPELIHSLIANAQCNVLPTFQSTGIKLKLLAALFAGRTCIVNSPMVVGTGLEPLCVIADSPAKMKEAILASWRKEALSSEEVENRKAILLSEFSNSVNAKKLLELF